jgi:hypothetical protein
MKLRLPDNLWKSPVIKTRLLQEACFECNHGISEKKHYWVMVPQADTMTGVIGLKNYEENLQNADPHELQQDFAKKIMSSLMAHASFDGLWIVGFTHPPTTYGVITGTENCWNRLIAIWLDEDGDPQYTVESDFPFVQQVNMGDQYYVGLAVQAHEQWKEMYGRKAMKSDMMLKDSQTTKAALEALK